MYKDFSQLEGAAGYCFEDKTLLKQAMTHSSYANERHMKKHMQDNERLEFLGDAVLGSYIAVSFYLQEVSGLCRKENLTKLRASLVCEPTLAFVYQST